MTITPALGRRHGAAEQPAEKLGNTLKFGGLGAASEAYRIAYGPKAPEGGEALFLAYAMHTLGRTPRPGDSLTIPSLDDLAKAVVPREVHDKARAMVKDGITLTANAKRRKDLKATEKQRVPVANAGASISAPSAKRPLAGRDMDKAGPRTVTPQTLLGGSLEATKAMRADLRFAALCTDIRDKVSVGDMRRALQRYPSGKTLGADLETLLKRSGFSDADAQAYAPRLRDNLMRSFSQRSVMLPLASELSEALRSGTMAIRALGTDTKLARLLADDVRAASAGDASAITRKLGLGESLAGELRSAPNGEAAGLLLTTAAKRETTKVDDYAAKIENVSGDLQLYKAVPAITEKILAADGTFKIPHGHELDLGDLEATNAAQEALLDEINRRDRGMEPVIVAAMAVGATAASGGIGAPLAIELGAALLAEAPGLLVGFAEARDAGRLAAAGLAEHDAEERKQVATLVGAALSMTLGVGGGKLITKLANKRLRHALHAITERVAAATPIAAVKPAEHAAEHLAGAEPLAAEDVHARLAANMMVRKLARNESKLVAAWMERGPAVLRTPAGAQHAIYTFGALYAEELMHMSDEQVVAQFNHAAQRPEEYVSL